MLGRYQEKIKYLEMGLYIDLSFELYLCFTLYASPGKNKVGRRGIVPEIRAAFAATPRKSRTWDLPLFFYGLVQRSDYRRLYDLSFLSMPCQEREYILLIPPRLAAIASDEGPISVLLLLSLHVPPLTPPSPPLDLAPR